MSARAVTVAALVCLLAGCSGPSAPKKRSDSSTAPSPDTAAPPDGDRKARAEERRRKAREQEQREKAARKRADDFLYRLGLTGMARAATVRSRFLALPPEDQAKALRTAAALQTFGRGALLKEDPSHKEAAFLRAHPELFPEP